MRQQLVTRDLVAPIPYNPLIDSWKPVEEYELFKSVDKAIIVPVGLFYGITDINNPFNFFNISAKRCYNKLPMREHICQYLNYFCHFYDAEGELYTMYAKIKYMIDIVQDYAEDDFIRDLKRYIIFNKSILWKIFLCNEDNYMIELKAKKGRSIPSLQYKTSHGKILMQMSMLINMVIPLITHFAYEKNIEPIDDLLLKVYDIIIYMSDVDIFSKFHETATSEVGRSEKLHKRLWDMQDIRGINNVTHTHDSIINILLNIIPKYVYDQNIISFNCSSIRNSNQYKVVKISYEYSFNKLSSSNRDADCQSDFDKYESYLIKQDEALYLQNKVNTEQSLLYIEDMFGPFSQEDIDYYIRRLESDGDSAFNRFQKETIFNLFFKYFGDPKSLYNIDIIGYVKLMIAAKRILESHGMVVLPNVVSSKVLKMPTKKAINKKIVLMIQSDPLWEIIDNIYKDEQIKVDILEKIGVLISSEFQIIAPEDKEIDGKVVDYHCALLLAKEYLEYITMI